MCGQCKFLFGLSLLESGLLHENVEKHNDFGLDFYVLVRYARGKWKRKNKHHLKNKQRSTLSKGRREHEL